ncbi:MAG TPA: hypothetical protein DCF68_17445 [Cyanothece sp. UBA12306]|nr:hypothetical protein [Cyanothece sp. UBA12306]
MKICNKIKSFFNRNSQALPPPEKVEPSNLEYENVLMILLEESVNGAIWGSLQGTLISHNIKMNQLAGWLENKGKEWQKQPDNYQELGERLRVLGRVATGRLGDVARRLGNQKSEVRSQKSEVILITVNLFIPQK